MTRIPANRTIKSSLLSLLGMVLSVSACSFLTDSDPAVLEIIHGDGQEGVAGTALEPLVFRVKNLDGTPRAGVAVIWSPWEGDGTVRAHSDKSDADGLLAATWTLGPDLGRQAVYVTAAGEDTVFQAWATPPEPTEWLEALEIRPEAEIAGLSIRAKVWVINNWGGTVRMETPSSCPGAEGYPALLDKHGWVVASHLRGCWTAHAFHSLAPGDSLEWKWDLGIGHVEPGEYTLRFRFDVENINDTPATLPGKDLPIAVGSAGI